MCNCACTVVSFYSVMRIRGWNNLIVDVDVMHGNYVTVCQRACLGTARSVAVRNYINTSVNVRVHTIFNAQ